MERRNLPGDRRREQETSEVCIPTGYLIARTSTIFRAPCDLRTSTLVLARTRSSVDRPAVGGGFIVHRRHIETYVFADDGGINLIAASDLDTP